MKIVIHADDLGLSQEVSDGIFLTHDEGVLTSASLMVNGEDVVRSAQQAKQRPALTLRLHFNLTEGRPVSSVEDVPLLTNAEGTLFHSFLSLWARYFFAMPATRRALRKQVFHELSNQIEVYQNHVGEDYPLLVDSHHHSHMIPFVFQLLMDLHSTHKLSYVRIPREMFFYPGTHAASWKPYLGSNIVKHVLLNGLARLNISKSAQLGISSCDFFVGVLFTGMMTLRVAEAAIAKVRDSASCEDMTEILFHPGGTVHGGIHNWSKPRPEEYVLDARREKETRELLRPEFKRLLSLWRDGHQAQFDVN